MHTRDPGDARLRGVLDRLHDTVKQDLHAADRALHDGDPAAAATHLDAALDAVAAILRDGGSGHPPPLAEAVDAALATARRRAGGCVRVTAVGTDPLDRPLSPPRIGLIADVVSEGVANAARHRPGAAVTVAASDHGAEVVVTVATRGGRPATVTTRPGGRGLSRLGERAHHLGGVLRTVQPADGHLLELRLPRVEVEG